MLPEYENKNKKPYPQPLQQIIGDNHFKLYRPFLYLWRHEGRYFRIVVPPGFEYDGASIPRVAWSLVGLRPVGLISAAACIHDWMYFKSGVLGRSYDILNDSRWEEVDYVWPRSQADKMFARMLREAGVGSVKRRLAYLAVKLFGGYHYGK